MFQILEVPGAHLAPLYAPPLPCHITHSSPATHRAAIFITPRSSNAMFQKYNPESFIRRLHQGLALTDSDISIIYLLKPLIFKSDILKGKTLNKKQLGGKIKLCHNFDRGCFECCSFYTMPSKSMITKSLNKLFKITSFFSVGTR